MIEAKATRRTTHTMTVGGHKVEEGEGASVIGTIEWRTMSDWELSGVMN